MVTSVTWRSKPCGDGEEENMRQREQQMFSKALKESQDGPEGGIRRQPWWNEAGSGRACSWRGSHRADHSGLYGSGQDLWTLA